MFSPGSDYNSAWDEEEEEDGAAPAPRGEEEGVSSPPWIPAVIASVASTCLLSGLVAFLAVRRRRAGTAETGAEPVPDTSCGHEREERRRSKRKQRDAPKPETPDDITLMQTRTGEYSSFSAKPSPPHSSPSSPRSPERATKKEVWSKNRSPEKEALRGAADDKYRDV